MDPLQGRGARFNTTSTTSASGSVSVTQAASSGRVHYITDVGGSSADATAQIRVYAGNTNYWMTRLGNSGAYEKHFKVPIAITSGSAVVVEVLHGSGSTYVNLAGYSIG